MVNSAKQSIKDVHGQTSAMESARSVLVCLQGLIHTRPKCTRYRTSHLSLVRHGRTALRRILLVADGEHRRHQRCQHQLQRCFALLGSVQPDLSRGSLDRIENRIVGGIRSQLIFTRGCLTPLKLGCPVEPVAVQRYTISRTYQNSSGRVKQWRQQLIYLRCTTRQITL